ncbi:MAG: leucine-rich repeat protein [Clostridia bacterium]|nr:leucine-rich repeat protein [Clostridia bacterium]
MKSIPKIKTIAVVLAFIMMFSFMSVPTFAASVTTYSQYGDLEYIVNKGEITITKCNDTVLGAVTIPETIDSMPVTVIGETAFEWCADITEVSLPSTIKTIEDEAFVYCMSLEQIIIPDSVESIGISAFEGCTSLKTAYLGSSVLSVGTYLFTGCSALEKIEVSADNGSFCSKDGILYSKDGQKLIACPGGIKGEISVADNTTEIGKSAFDCCSEITSAMLPEGVVNIGDFAFNGCTLLEKIVLPSTLTTIGESAFRDCQSLTQIRFPSSVKEIGENSFFGCYALERADFEGEAPTIGVKAFDNTADSFIICYDYRYSASWAPNGETELNGYKLSAVYPVSKLGLVDGSTLSIKEGMLMGVEAGTTALELAANFTAASRVAVFDETDNRLDSASEVVTSYRVYLIIDGELADGLVIVVTGDVTGDGKVNSRDIAAVQKHTMETTLLDGVFSYAGDVSGDGNINSRDIARIQKDIMG